MRKRDRIKLYPNHQHHWSSLTDSNPDLLTCDVCVLEMPRNVVEAYHDEIPTVPAPLSKFPGEPT